MFFTAGDTYRIRNQFGFCITATSAVFFQNLSVDDVLSVVANQDAFQLAPYNADGPNTFCLADLAPVGP